MFKKAKSNNKKVKEKKPFNKKKFKKIVKRVVLILVIMIIALFILNKCGIISLPGSNSGAMEQKLTTYTVGTRNITQMLSSSGTIEPNDKYSITALVSGDILNDYVEEGDTVIEDQLLYSIDAENMDSNITRAENTLKNANKSLQDARENAEKLSVESDYSGTVKKMYVDLGDEITAGTLIADVVDDSVMCIDVPFMDADANTIRVGDRATVTFTSYETMEGTVKKVSNVSKLNSLGVAVREVTISVKNTGSITTSTRAYAQVGDVFCTSEAAFYYNDEGKVYAKIGGDVDAIYFDEGTRISKGQHIIKLVSEDVQDQLEKLSDTVEEARDSLEDAQDAYDNYNIKAPITGKVMAKNYKAGDTLSSGSGMGSANVLAEIYDMSALKFTMTIDELDIDKLSKGQEVIVTCDSREGYQYYGVVTNISIQATTTNGTSTYPVEVTIENVEDESQRTVADDGTINKTYKTGMTSTEKTYSLISTEEKEDSIVYTYSEDLVITKTTADGGTVTYFDGEEQLNEYLDGTYTLGSNFYYFSEDYSSLTLEVQNDSKMLRPGMNVDAEILVQNKQNVIAVPLNAVGRGNVVKVLKNANDAKTAEDNTTTQAPSAMPEFNGEKPEFDGEMPEFNGERPSGNPENAPAITFNTGSSSYGTAETDAEYEEVRVTVGIDDGEYVEILSGLEVGDVIIVESQQQSMGNTFMMGGMGQGGMMGMAPGDSMSFNGGPGMGSSGMSAPHPTFG